MADFKRAIEHVLRHEGGYTGRAGIPGDAGGPTNMGWSLRQMKADGWDVDGDGDVDVEDVEALTPELVRARYRERYWTPLRLDEVRDEQVATKVLDLAVHAGTRRAVVVLQRALNALLGPRLREDGDLGPKTLAAVNAVGSPRHLLLKFSAEQADFYRAVLARNPDLEGCRRNFMRRAAWPFQTGGVA